MSIARLIKSLKHLTNRLDAEKKYSNEATKTKSVISPKTKLFTQIEKEEDLNQNSLTTHFSTSIKTHPTKYYIIGIPIKVGENKTYKSLHSTEKAKFILKAIHHCIKQIEIEIHAKLEKQDTVIIQLREYAFEGKQKTFFTAEEKNEILKILSQIFPIPFNLIISTGGIAYTTTLSPELGYHKIEKIKTNYQHVYLKLTNVMHLDYEKMQMDDKLKHNTITQFLCNKNYILTNQQHYKNNNKPLSFTKKIPYQEIERLERGANLSYKEIEEMQHYFSTIVFNPGKNKNNLLFDSHLAIHYRTCADICYPQLIKPSYNTPLPNLFIINSASYRLDLKTISEMKKWHDYFFQADLEEGSQYGKLNNKNLHTFFSINFYNLNIKTAKLTTANQSRLIKKS